MNTTDFRTYFDTLRKKRLGIAVLFCVCALAFAVIFTIQCYFLHTQYEVRFDLYLYGSGAPAFLFWSIAATCLLLFGLSFAFPREAFQEETEPLLFSQRALFLCIGLAHLFLLGYLLLSPTRVFSSVLVTVLTVITAVGCVAYGLFASEVFLRHRQSSPYFGLTTQFCAIAFWLVRIFSLYFDRTTPMTSPLKMLEMMAGFALCFYLLCAIRRVIGIPLPRLQWAVNGIAFLLASTLGGSRVYLWILYPNHFSVDTLFGILALIWGIVIGIELWQGCVTRLLHRYTDYLVFGVLTTAVNFICYFLLTRFFEIPVLSANIAAFIVSVLFAYAVNKLFVFETKRHRHSALLLESVSFFVSRIATLLLEELILFVFVEKLLFYDLAIKIIAAVIVVITNYLTGRFFVFRKESSAEKSVEKST